MHKLAMGLALLALAASPAWAGESGSPFHDGLDRATRAGPAMQAGGTITTPSIRLPNAAEEWVAAEAARQAASPRSVALVSLAIEEALERDIKRMARRQQVHPYDVTMAILLQVMFEARDRVEREVKGRTDAEAAARLARAEADLKAALPFQSQVSLFLAAQ